MPKFFVGFVAGFLLLLSASAAHAATTNVSITSTGFLPEAVTVTAGDTVVWTNNDTTDHTATDDELNWDTDVIAAGRTGSIVFNTAGTFTYSDTIDPTLTGTVTVRAKTSTSPTPTATPLASGATPAATAKPKVAQPVSGTFETTLMILSLGLFMLGTGIYSLKRL